MLLRLYRGTGPGEIILVILTAGLIWLNAFLHPAGQLPYYDSDPMPLYGLLKMMLGTGISGMIFTFALVLVMVFLVANFNTSHFFINERTFIPSLTYILFTGLFPGYQVLNPVLPASVFLMLAIRIIADSYRKQGVTHNFFDASFLIGTGSLFYANLIWFGILIFIGIAIFRTGNIKEILISVIGLAAPFILTIGIYFIAGLNIQSLKETVIYNLFSSSEKYSYPGLVITGIVILQILILVSLIFLVSTLNSKKIKSRKTFSTLIWTVVICLAEYFVVPSASAEIIWLMAIPVSYIIAHYLIFSRNKIIAELSTGIMFIVIILMQIRNLL
jgi:hypothetical protein